MMIKIIELKFVYKLSIETRNFVIMNLIQSHIFYVLSRGFIGCCIQLHILFLMDTKFHKQMNRESYLTWTL